MPEATTTTLGDHAILWRQSGDGFYLTDRGGLLILILLVAISGVIILSANLARRP